MVVLVGVAAARGGTNNQVDRGQPLEEASSPCLDVVEEEAPHDNMEVFPEAEGD